MWRVESSLHPVLPYRTAHPPSSVCLLHSPEMVHTQETHLRCRSCWHVADSEAVSPSFYKALVQTTFPEKHLRNKTWGVYHDGTPCSPHLYTTVTPLRSLRELTCAILPTHEVSMVVIQFLMCREIIVFQVFQNLCLECDVCRCKCGPSKIQAPPAWHEKEIARNTRCYKIHKLNAQLPWHIAHVLAVPQLR